MKPIKELLKRAVGQSVLVVSPQNKQTPQREGNQMPNFQEQFALNPGKPIEYKGELLYPIDYVQVPKKFSVTVRLISTNSEWSQIIRLRVNKGGYLICNGKKGPRHSLYADGMPSSVTLSGYAKDEKLIVFNAWATKDWMGNDVVDSWLNGAAMKKVAAGNTIRYYCNDGHPDDNFDDLVFEVTVL